MGINLPPSVNHCLEQLAADSSIGSCIADIEAKIINLGKCIAEEVKTKRTLIDAANKNATDILADAGRMTSDLDLIKDQFYHPQTGLAEQLMSKLSARNQSLYEVEYTSRVISNLECMDKVRQALNEFTEANEAKQLIEASEALMSAKLLCQQMQTSLSSPHTSIGFYADATAHIQVLYAKLLEMLITTLQSICVFSVHDNGDSTSLSFNTLTQLQAIKDQLNVYISAAINCEVTQQVLTPFCTDYMKIILMPCLNGATFVVNNDPYTISTLMAKQNGEISKTSLSLSSAQARFINLFSGLQEAHTLFPRHQANTLKTLLGHTVCQQIIKHTLEVHVPNCPEDFEYFREFAAAACIFEQNVKDAGLAPEDTDVISTYVADIDGLYSRQRQKQIFAQARALLAVQDLEDERVNLSDTAGMLAQHFSSFVETSKNDIMQSSIDNSSNIIEDVRPCPVFPWCRVSHSVVAYTRLLSNTLQEQLKVKATCKIPLKAIARDLVELYRAISFARYDAIKAIPAQAMIYHNDLMYLADFVVAWAIVDSEPPSAVDLVYPLREMALGIFKEQISVQRKAIAEMFVEFHEFIETLHLHAIDLADIFTTVTFQLEELARRWMPVLPRHLCTAALGLLYEDCLRICLDQILLWEDITEQESTDLNILFQKLLPVAHLFLQLQASDSYDNLDEHEKNSILPLPEPPKDIEQPAILFTQDQLRIVTAWVPNFELFFRTTTIMLLSFRDIMSGLHQGDYRCFKVNDLLRLVRALFQDSDLRRKNVNEILRSVNEGLVLRM